MANSYSQIYLHVVFAVKGRKSLIKDEWTSQIYTYIAGACKNRGHHLYVIGGMSDHLHLLVGLNPKESVSSFVQSIKIQSSRWINEHYANGHFSWQAGYGAFSYSRSLIPVVIKYIENQKEHHRNKTFREELISLLEKAGIDYNPLYLMEGVDEFRT